MSKLVIELDTDEKTLSATIDGKAIENITQVMIYKDEYSKSGYYADFSVEKEKVGDVNKYTHYCVSSATIAAQKNLIPTKTEGVYVKPECKK
jgi:hypothetical protein